MNNHLRKPVPGTPEAIAEAAALLAAGRLVGLPTETVYGLAGDAGNPEAVARIYAAKGRPRFNPLIAHVPGLAEAEAEAVFTPAALRLAERFWPGPLTLVLPVRHGGNVCDLARAGLDSVALRVPSLPLARAVLAAAGRPIAAPSANRSGRVSTTAAEEVAAELGDRVDLILDGGRTSVGVESTIVSLLGSRPTLLRPGGLSSTLIEDALGAALVRAGSDDAAPRAPGMLSSHYAPTAPVRLGVTGPEPGEALLAFGAAIPGGHAGPVANLSARGDLTEAAANLYRMLRELDAAGPKAIAVMPIPQEGLGEAINDRLARAAAPR